MNFDKLKSALIAAATDLVGRETELCNLDSFVGDGDHGVSIRKGFTMVLNGIERENPQNMFDLFMTSALAIADQTGGAIGPILASFLLGMGSTLKGKDELDVKGIADMFASGLQSVQELGEAQPGDCTMVDALYPAVVSLKAATTDDMKKAMEDAAAEAFKGSEATANMVAKRGRAKNLSERSLGYVDAGSRSMYYFIKAFADSI